MAKSRRHRRARGSRSGRLTGRLGAVVVILVLVAWFAFTQVFFDPFEESHPSFDLLVPRDVDLYVRRERLDTDFSTFPQPALLERLEFKPEWRALVQTDWWKGLEWPKTLAKASEDVQAAVADLPVDVLDLMGSEVVVIGRQVADGGPWALLARLSAQGKLAVEGALVTGVLKDRTEHAHPSLPGTTYHEVALDGTPYFFVRDLDLLVVSSDETLVRDVLTTARGDAELSLGLSRMVDEHRPASRAAPDEAFDLGFTADFAQLRALFTSDEGAEDASAAEPPRDLLAAALPRIVDTSLLRASVGRFEIIDGRVALRMHADLEPGAASADKGGLLGRPAFMARERLAEVLSWMPEDVAMVLSMNVDLRAMLGVLIESMDVELRSLVDGTLRDISRLGTDKILDAPSLVGRLARVVEDEFTLALRQSYHEVPPGHQPMPSFAVAFRVRDAAGFAKIEQFMLLGHELLGMPKDGMFQVEDGVGTRKYAELPGRAFGEVAWMILDDRLLLLSNDNELLESVVDVYSLRSPSMAESRGVAGERLRTLLAELAPLGGAATQANAALWMHGARLLSLTEPYAEYLADLETQLDFAGLRAEQRAELVRTRYGGRTDLDDAEQSDLDAQLDALLEDEEQRRLTERVPERARAWLESLQWTTLAHQGVLALRLGERTAGLHVELSTVLER